MAIQPTWQVDWMPAVVWQVLKTTEAWASDFLKILFWYFKINYLLIWPQWVLAAAWEIFAVVHKLSSCGTQAQSSLVCGILVPWSGIELVSSALQGRFLTGPPGKSSLLILILDMLMDLHTYNALKRLYFSH